MVNLGSLKLASHFDCARGKGLNDVVEAILESRGREDEEEGQGRRERVQGGDGGDDLEEGENRGLKLGSK